jgi:putative phosphoribosyl transferase
MYYFPSRKAVGELLSDKLMKYRYEDCAVVALSDGAVIVGAQIASRLHSPLNLLLTDAIHLQGETDVLAQIDHLGDMTYNDKYSTDELNDMRSENYNYIEQQKIEKVFEMNRLLGQGGVIDVRLLRGRNIIVVSDGLMNGMAMRAASEYLKPIRIQKLIMVTPFASVPAVDQMHILADEIVCLNVLEDIISIDHYYDDNAMPSHERIVQILEDIVLHWE